MNHSKKNYKKKQNFWVVAVIGCSAVLVALIAITVALHFGSQENTKPDQDPQSQTGTIENTTVTETDPTETTEAEETVPEETEAPAKTLEVVTDYGTFLLSGHWNGEMRTEITDAEVYTVSAYGQIGSHQEQHIFDVRFGGSDGDNVGYIADKNGKTVAVNVILSDFEPDDSWTETEKLEFYGMQNEVNSIVGRLELVSGEDTEDNSDAENLRIETPYATLLYPSIWGDRIRTEVSGDTAITVSFYGAPAGVSEVHLFDIILGGDGENSVGILKTADGAELAVAVWDSAAAPGDDWSDEAVSEFYAMIDGINHVLSGLEAAGNFTFI